MQHRLKIVYIHLCVHAKQSGCVGCCSLGSLAFQRVLRLSANDQDACIRRDMVQLSNVGEEDLPECKH